MLLYHVYEEKVCVWLSSTCFGRYELQLYIKSLSSLYSTKQRILVQALLYISAFSGCKYNKERQIEIREETESLQSSRFEPSGRLNVNCSNNPLEKDDAVKHLHIDGVLQGPLLSATAVVLLRDPCCYA